MQKIANTDRLNVQCRVSYTQNKWSVLPYTVELPVDCCMLIVLKLIIDVIKIAVNCSFVG